MFCTKHQQHTQSAAQKYAERQDATDIQKKNIFCVFFIFF